MKISFILLCLLLSLRSVYANNAVELYKQLMTINYDYELLQKAYDDAKAREQSKENRMLTAAAVAAAGIGGMELAQGLAEQKAL